MAKTLLMKNHWLFPVSILLLASCSDSMEFQPDITWGGRIVALSKDPKNDNRIIGASPSGGLFISNSKGASWSHVAGLPVFEMNDVKFSNYSSDLVIATSSRDLKVNNGGGIWRSTDGGKTWARPAGAVFMQGGKAVAGHGYGIAFEPGESPKVYAGTEWGIAISNNNGNNWVYNPLRDDGVQVKVFSVLAARNGLAIAATSDGIYRTTDGGGKWVLVSGILSTRSTRSFCFLPANNNNVFLSTDDYKIFYSGDFGKTWKEINSPGGKNREAFIRCTAQAEVFLGAPVTVTYLYFGSGVDLYRKILPNPADKNGNVNFGNGWDKLSVDHSDPSDIVFDNAGNSLLLSGDGGVFSTSDHGNSWQITGSGRNGLNALQINEASAQENFENGRKNYIYFGTQDNSLWGSLDGGGTWSAFGNEGHSLMLRRRALMPKGNLMAVTLDDSVSQYGSKQGWVDAADWQEVPARASDPVIIPEGDLLDAEPRDRFMQISFSKGFISKTRIRFDQYNFNNTYNGGASWSRIGHMTAAPTAQYAKVSSATGEPVIYQPYFTGEITKNGYGKLGLVRLSKTNRTTEGVLEFADGNGFGTLGTFPTEFKWYNVFAVNPSDPDNVIIADIETSEIKTTHDGGKNWFPEPALSYLITGGGAISFFQTVDCCPKMLVTCISFNPDDPSQIAIGTRENGIFFTWDAGNIWYKLDKTDQITNASSIFFYFDGCIMVSSYGRGLWKFKPEKSRVSTHFIEFKDRVKETFKGLHVLGLADGKLKPFTGHAQDSLTQTGNRLIANNYDSSLTIAAILKNNFKDIAGQYNLHFADPRTAEKTIRSYEDRQLLSVPVRGFVLNKNQAITGLLLSYGSWRLYQPGELQVRENNNPYIRLLDDSLNPVNGLAQRGSFYIDAVHFNPSGINGNGYAQIYLDGKPYGDKITVDADSSFQVHVLLPAGISGGVQVRVIQESQKRPVSIVRHVPVYREMETGPGRKR